MSNNEEEDKCWPEIRKTFDTKRYELKLVGAEISQRLDENKGCLDSNLFKLKHLNFLEISKTTLNSIPNEIGALIGLSTVLLHSNAIEIVSSELGKLKSITHLDLSNNLIKSLPSELKNLVELKALNLSGNLLQELFPLDLLNKCAVINVSRNKFTKLPVDLGSSKLENLSHIDASFNEINELHEHFVDLPVLKTFNLEHNQIKVVPSVLHKCAKLKDFLLKDNKLQDNRLKKLIEQDKLKAIFDYLERVYIEELKKAPKKPAAAGAKKPIKNGSVEVTEFDLVNVLHFNTNSEELKSKEVCFLESVQEERPFILCCIIRNLNLETEGNFKNFLSIQTKIQEETCQKRTLGTIATHDLKSIKGNITYEALDPNKIDFIPLGREKSITAFEFYEKLYEEAEAERKAKKRNQLSGLYKYLNLLTNKSVFPVLKDGENNFISMPPLTNSEKTRMSLKTKDIFVEITSNQNLDFCKKVMEELIIEMLNFNLCSKNQNELLNDKLKNLKLNEEASNEDEISKVKQTMWIQQTKIVDSKGNLKCVYPSRIDLSFNNSSKYKVVRLYDD